MHRSLDIVQSRYHDHVDVRARFLDPSQHLDAVHSRHLDVQDQKIVLILVDQAERGYAFTGDIDLVIPAGKNALAAPQDDFLVVNQQDSAFHSLFLASSADLPPNGR